MTSLRQRLEDELRLAFARLRAMGPVTEEPEAVPSSTEEVFEAQLDQAREMSIVARARLADRVRRLATALLRMDTGQYAKCVECGAAIAERRLQALPEVETCIACQQQLEQRRRAASEAELEASAA